MALPSLIDTRSRTSREQRRSRGESRYATIAGYGVRLQSCNWLKCGGVAVSCIPACAAGPLACVACLGGLYAECKDCFGLP